MNTGAISQKTGFLEANCRTREALVERGAQGTILGCTEISMLVGPQDASVPLFDTTVMHAGAAAALAFEQQRGQL